MTERQKRFCELYAVGGNATQAAKDAGYSAKTARSIASENLLKPDILEYVNELRDIAADARIASLAQVRAYWSDVLHNPGEKTADRIRAGEMLAKSYGAFLHLGGKQDDGGAGYLAGEHDGQDVIVMLPDNNRDRHLQQYRDPEDLGEVEGWTSSR